MAQQPQTQYEFYYQKDELLKTACHDIGSRGAICKAMCDNLSTLETSSKYTESVQQSQVNAKHTQSVNSEKIENYSRSTFSNSRTPKMTSFTKIWSMFANNALLGGGDRVRIWIREQRKIKRKSMALLSLWWQTWTSLLHQKGNGGKKISNCIKFWDYWMCSMQPMTSYNCNRQVKTTSSSRRKQL